MEIQSHKINKFKTLPKIKNDLEKLNFHNQSLETIKSGLSEENFRLLSESNNKQLAELKARKEIIESEIAIQTAEIELDQKRLETSLNMLENELQETTFLFERNAIGKDIFSKKRNDLQGKIRKTKKVLADDEKCLTELKFYSDHVGDETYFAHTLKSKQEEIKSKISEHSRWFRLKIIIPVFLIILLIVGGVIFYNPVVDLIKEKIAWNKAVKENTFQSYQNYIFQYLNGKHTIEAVSRQEESLWLEARSTKNQKLLDQYISLFFNGKHVEEARAIIDEQVWDSINKLGLAPAYQYYLNAVYQGKHADEARQRIAELVPDTVLIDTRDNKTYRIIKIGDKVWMAENLKYDMPDAAACYGGRSENCEKFGMMYNAYAAVTAAPPGWHLPSRNEYEELILFCGGEREAYNKLAEGGSTGFNFLKGGYRTGSPGEEYKALGESTAFWTSTENGSYNAYVIFMSKTGIATLKESDKQFLNYIRCVKD